MTDSGQVQPDSIPQPLLVHVPEYLSKPRADALLAWALRDVHWREERIVLFGRHVAVPRLVSWYGDAGVGYRYAKLNHWARGWPSVLGELRDALARDFAVRCNFVLLNRYRTGSDSMGWHADDEAMLDGPVVSVSLGSTRRLRLRGGRAGATATLTLAHGTLLLHQRHYYHALPKVREAVGERVNLTFRRVLTTGKQS